MVFRRDPNADPAIQEGLDAAELAQEAADRNDPDWAAGGTVEQAVRDWLHTKIQFTSDDIWNEVIDPMIANGTIEDYEERRVVANYITRMRTDSLIDDTGFTQPSTRRRGAPIKVWRAKPRRTMGQWRRWSGSGDRQQVQRGIDSKVELIEKDKQRLVELEEKIQSTKEAIEEAERDVDYVRRTGGYNRDFDDVLSRMNERFDVRVVLDPVGMGLNSIEEEEIKNALIADEDYYKDIQEEEGVRILPWMIARVFVTSDNGNTWDERASYQFAMEDENGILGGLAWTQGNYGRGNAADPETWRRIGDNSLGQQGLYLQEVMDAINSATFFIETADAFSPMDRYLQEVDMGYSERDPFKENYNEEFQAIRPVIMFNEDEPMGEAFKDFFESKTFPDGSDMELPNDVFEMFEQLLPDDEDGWPNDTIWTSFSEKDRSIMMELSSRLKSNPESSDVVREYLEKSYISDIQEMKESLEGQGNDGEVAAILISEGHITDAINKANELADTPEEVEELLNDWGIMQGGWSGNAMPVLVGGELYGVDTMEFVQSDFANSTSRADGTALISILYQVNDMLAGGMASFQQTRKGMKKRKDEIKISGKPVSMIGSGQSQTDLFKRPDSRQFDRRRYSRTINRNVFLGSNRQMTKNDARNVANIIRNKGLNARVIPSSNGFRVYIGNRKKR